MIATPIIPVMIAMNTYNQIHQRQEIQRKEMERRQEIEYREKEKYTTSCIQVVYDTDTVYCCYQPLPPETSANMIMVCNAFMIKEGVR